MTGTKILNNSNTRFLIITKRGFPWINVLNTIAGDITIVRDPAECEKILASTGLDIVLYDDETFDMPASKVIEEIHLQKPRILVAVISDNLAPDYYSVLIEAGAVDTMSADHETDMMMRRINSLVRQSQKNQELAFRTRKLHAVNLLSQKLHITEHPTVMIVDAIELICNYFDIYAVAITIDNNDHFQLYAGTRNINNRRRLYETKLNMDSNNPLRQVIASKMSLVFPDIKPHPFYKQIPVIKSPESSVIVPIKHGSTILGSMALFSDKERLTSADVAIFELLANNFGTAYQSITREHSREIDVQSMRYVLQAWPDLNGVYSKQEITEVIHDYVLEIESIKTVGLWLFAQSDMNDAIIYSGFPALDESLKSMFQQGELAPLQQEFDDGIQPLTFHKSMAQIKALMALYAVTKSSQITIVPLAGNSFEGMMFVSSHATQGISATDISLIENLARVTANVLERNTLIESIQEERHKLQEQTGRVEGVLRSIDEGIFFVDDSKLVVYCNPQFTELTNISPSQVLNNPFSKLFQLLSVSSPQHEQIYDHLINAANQMQGTNSGEDYPIIEITSPPDKAILVEFMPVNTSSAQSGWIGVIATKTEQISGHLPQGQNTILQNMLEDMTMPLIELNNTTMMLPQQYDMLSPHNFELVLQRLENHVRDVQSMWGNFVQIYKGETEGIKIRPTTVDPTEFVENLLTNRRMLLYSRQIRFDKQAVDALIQVDERQMRQVFINLVEFLSHVSNRGAPIFVSISKQSNQIVFSLLEKTTILLEEDLSNIFTPERDDNMKDDLYPHRLGMYLAKQIVNAHGGQLSILSNRGTGVMIKMQLPLMSDEEVIIPIIVEEVEDVLAYKQPTKGLTMTLLESEALFLEELYPQIEVQGHNIILEKRLDDVLLNLKMTKVDIILIEVERSNTGLVGQVQRIRAQSEVPIVIISLPDFEDECLQGLAHGADDYFILPFNEEKLLAQLYAISKRQELAARTAEPITVDDLMIDFSRRRVYLKGNLIDLTTKEYELLRVLVMNRGHVMTHKRLLAKVWGPEYDNETQYLWVNISRLRRKLEPTKDSPRYIQNEPRVGYVFSTDER